MTSKSTNLQIKEDKVIEKELSYKIGGILFKTHNTLGRYCKERQYCDFIERELTDAKIPFVREFPIEVAGRKSNFVDFIIENKILLEVKAKRLLEKDDFYQTKRYLHLKGLELGLLVNFRDTYLKPKRILQFVDSDTFVDRDRSRGFTLVEFMIVISLAVLLTGGIALYSRTAERQLILYRDQVKIVSFLQKARSLSLSAFAAGGIRACGFGVFLDMAAAPFRLVMFSNPPVDPDESACENNVQMDYDPLNVGSLKIDELTLDPRIQFRTLGICSTDFTHVFFIPPDPTVIINKNPLLQSAKVVLETTLSTDVSTKRVVVTKGGQITAASACP